jgi:hypothetical protein
VTERQSAIAIVVAGVVLIVIFLLFTGNTAR